MVTQSTLPAEFTQFTQSKQHNETLDLNLDGLDFVLPPDLEASEPPEARGLSRDEVRLLVSYPADGRIEHARFRDIGSFLDRGDVLAINTSGTLNAALPASRADGTALELRLSTHLPDDRWTVELRRPRESGTTPFFGAVAGETLRLAGVATAMLLAPHRRHSAPASSGPARLWLARLHLPEPVNDYLQRYGFPIRYGYVKQQWPLSYYQTVYVTEAGSAEMPSAGRAFTSELLAGLVAQGVQIAPLLLHTGVASLEAHEPPYEEYYRVPPRTAAIVNAARARRRRVVAVGTTVVRALETVTGRDGVTHAGEGWTDLVITPARGMRAVNGLLTGLHEPRATHLAMLEALAGRDHLRAVYGEALRQRYLWHEFGDLHLMLR